MDSHTVGIYGVLLAVVMVGVVGLYFTSMATNETSVLYVGGGYEAPKATAWTPPFYSQLNTITKAFTVKGKGITGMHPTRQGTATITSDLIWDLRMPKNTIVCTAELQQENDTVALYTCGNNVSIGGTIECDSNGTHDSSTTPTDASSCNGAAAIAGSPDHNFGAFVICNMGSPGALNATLLNLTINNITTNGTQLDDVLYNAIDNDAGKGCVGACNLCNESDIPSCYKAVGHALVPNGVYPECEFFDTSGQCLCECFSIHPDEDDVHLLKSGYPMEFVMRKSMSSTGLNSSGDC